MKKLLIALILITTALTLMAGYSNIVKSEVKTWHGVYQLEKSKPYLVDGSIKHLLLLAPPEALDSLGISFTEGDTLSVQAAETKGALLVTTIKLGDKVFSIRSEDLKDNFYDEPSTVKVSPAKCIGCKLCVSPCPVDAITMIKGKAVIDSAKCVSCGICIDGNGRFRGCPVRAISR
ncbi:MAG: 4Fe-4S binding protein [Candidatus Cloacimonetes bacterium]|nr:4Fe-4S binding protein [Candidatus Cloacimonadota bacterium]